jgi:hypothetical protein
MKQAGINAKFFCEVRTKHLKLSTVQSRPIPQLLWLYPRDGEIPSPEKTTRSPEVPTLKNIYVIFKHLNI